MYVILGYRIGTWTNDKGEVLPTRKIYLGREFSKKPGEHADGVRTYEFSLAGEDVISGFAVGDKVNVYFDQYKRVSMIQPMY